MLPAELLRSGSQRQAGGKDLAGCPDLDWDSAEARYARVA
jgi:hypothetical protein